MPVWRSLMCTTGNRAVSTQPAEVVGSSMEHGNAAAYVDGRSEVPVKERFVTPAWRHRRAAPGLRSTAAGGCGRGAAGWAAPTAGAAGSAGGCAGCRDCTVCRGTSHAGATGKR